jgi:hypothetical protein
MAESSWEKNYMILTFLKLISAIFDSPESIPAFFQYLWHFSGLQYRILRAGLLLIGAV